jgi:hypothetical protein
MAVPLKVLLSYFFYFFFLKATTIPAVVDLASAK